MYKELTSEQRYTISVLLQKKCSLSFIAKTIGVCVSTVSREKRRNSNVQGVYDGRLAALKARRRKARTPSNCSISPHLRCRVFMRVRDKDIRSVVPLGIIGARCSCPEPTRIFFRPMRLFFVLPPRWKIVPFHIFYLPPWRKILSANLFNFPCGGRPFLFLFTIFRHGGKSSFFHRTLYRTRVGSLNSSAGSSGRPSRSRAGS